MTERIRAQASQPRRKTLDDIRREIDAEFVPAEPESREDDDASALEALRVRERRPKRRAYLKTALLCTIVVEVFILGYLAGRYYSADGLESLLSTFTAGSAAPAPPSASVMSAQPPATVTPETPSPLVAVEPQASERDVTSSADAAARVAEAERAVAPPAAIEPPRTMVAVPVAPAPPQAMTAGTPDPRRVTSGQNPGTTTARRVTPDAKVAAPEPKVVPPETKIVALALPGPGDWVESQGQLRTALREWLALSGYAGSSSDSDDAEVVLGADGQTGKTRIPVRVGPHTVIREQRWKRDARGWHIVEESQVQSPRPR
jgi:hypothetical protein